MPQFPNQIAQSYSSYAFVPMLVAALSAATPILSVERELGVSFRAGTISSSRMSVVETEVSMSRVVTALERLAQYLTTSSQELELEDKRLLYAHRWDLYD